MASSTKRAELHAELTRLRKQHYEDMTKALFGGFTAEEEEVHQERLELMAALFHQLEVLGPE